MHTSVARSLVWLLGATDLLNLLCQSKLSERGDARGFYVVVINTKLPLSSDHGFCQRYAVFRAVTRKGSARLFEIDKMSGMLRVTSAKLRVKTISKRQDTAFVPQLWRDNAK